MTVSILPLGAIGTNCYIIKKENDTVVIDPGDCNERLISEIGELSSLKAIFLTHRHCDHLSGAVSLKKMSEAPIGIHSLDEAGLYNKNASLASDFGGVYPFPIGNEKADILFSGDSEYNLGKISVKVIETPGHSIGGVSFIIEDSVFSGDTLFSLSVGRTDFDGGSYKELQKSLKKYLQYREYKLYPGHGEPSSINFEIQNNPYMKEL